MHIYDQDLVTYDLADPLQKTEIFLPRPSYNGIFQPYLKLPYIHETLLNVVQVGRLYIKRCYYVQVLPGGLTASLSYGG